jgi:hypothetical protein
VVRGRPARPRRAFSIALAGLVLTQLVPLSALAEEKVENLPAPPVLCYPDGCYGRDIGPNIMDNTGLGDFVYSPPKVHVGETITARMSPSVNFGINVLMTYPGGNPGEFVEATSVAAGTPVGYPSYAGDPSTEPHASDLHVCAGSANTRTVTSCTYKATSPTHGWVRQRAVIGNGPARGVEEGYYAVLAHGYGISGLVSLSNGKPMAGVSISISGSASDQTRTDPAGIYSFTVPKGDYTVTAGGGLCVEPVAGQCTSSAKVSIPGSKVVNFKAGSEGVIDGTVRDSSAKPIPGVTIHVEGKGGQPATTDNSGYYRAELPKGKFTVSATQQVQEPGKDASGKPITKTVDKEFCAARTSTSGTGCSTRATVNVPPDQTVDFTPKGDAGLLVAIRSDAAISQGFVKVRATISNPRTDEIKYLTFADPKGMKVEAVGASGDTTAGTQQVLTLTDGPTPEPPTGLAPGASVTLSYRFVAVNVGKVALSVKATGTVLVTGGTSKTVEGITTAVATVTDRDVKRDDIEKSAEDGIEDLLSAGGEGQQALDLQAARGIQTTLNPLNHEVSVADVTAGGALGIPPDASVIMSQRPELKVDYFKAWSDGFYGKAEKKSAEVRDWVVGMYNNVTDPDSQKVFAEGVVRSIKDLPTDIWHNAGYAGQALLSPATAEGWDTTYKASAKAVDTVRTAGANARAKMADFQAQNAVKQREDPIGFVIDQQKALGESNFDLAETVLEAVAGDLEVRGGVAVAGKVLGPIARGGAAVIGDIVSIPARRGEMTRNLKLAQKAMDSFQQLPLNAVLDEASLVNRAGYLPSDAKAIQQDVLGALEKKFGKPFVLGGRSSNPLSALIDVVPKKQFMKQKAVDAIDLFWADPSLAGQVAVTDLGRIEAAENALRGKPLDALAAKNPGFREVFDERVAEQKKLSKEWADSERWARASPGSQKYKDYESSLRFLVDKSKDYPKGITVLSPVPGRPLPHGIRYLEQLDEPAFLTQKGISQTEATALRSDLAHYPDAIKTKIGTRTVNGSTAFIEELVGKPHGSDFDLEFFGPADGMWPEGKRGQIWHEFSALMKKNVSRFPVHLASDAAADLPSKNLAAAVPYVLDHVPLAGLRAAAEDWANRFKQLSTNARATASKLRAAALRDEDFANLTASPDAKNARLAQARNLRARADDLLKQADNWDKYSDPDKLLENRKPGQKTINFTSSSVTVGHGTGGR